VVTPKFPLKFGARVTTGQQFHDQASLERIVGEQTRRGDPRSRPMTSAEPARLDG